MMGNCFISIFEGIIFLMAIGIIVFVILLTFSPKIRGKFMSNQVKSVKYMTDYAKKILRILIRMWQMLRLNLGKML